MRKTLFGFTADFSSESSEYPFKIHKVFLQVYSLLQGKILATKLQSTSKAKILFQDKKKRYGKADAYHSVFFAVLDKKIAFEADTVL